MAITVVSPTARSPGYKEAIHVAARIQTVLQALDVQFRYSARFICFPGVHGLVVRGVDCGVASTRTAPPRRRALGALHFRRDGRRVHAAVAVAQIGSERELARHAGSRPRFGLGRLGPWLTSVIVL